MASARGVVWRLALTVCAFLSVHLVNAYNVQISNYPEEGDSYTLNFFDGDMTVAVTADLCATVSQELCFVVQDTISSTLYNGVTYTPVLPHSQMEDHQMNRTALLMYIRERFNYESYLEIGCADDSNFTPMSRLVRRAVGVDPEQGGTLRMTSDAYFAASAEQFDLVFIDGLHEAVQVLRDVRNALALLAPGGLVLVHDSHPRHRASQLSLDDPEVNVGVWTGDVWRAIVLLKLEEDLELVTGDFDMGVAVLRRRKFPQVAPPAAPSLPLVSAVLALPDPSALVRSLGYGLLAADRKGVLSLVTAAELREWL
jgi:hypothetical protein